MLRLVGKGNGYYSCDWLAGGVVGGGNWIGLVNYATAGRKRERLLQL